MESSFRQIFFFCSIIIFSLIGVQTAYSQSLSSVNMSKYNEFINSDIPLPQISELDYTDDDILDNKEISFCDNRSSNIKSGIGTEYKHQLYFFDWSGVTIKDGSRKVFKLNNGQEIVATFSKVVGSGFYADKLGWIWDENGDGNPEGKCNNCADRYYDTGQNSAIKCTIPQDEVYSFKVTFKSTINGKTLPIDLVVIDGEGSERIHDMVTYITNGSDFEELEGFGDKTGIVNKGKELIYRGTGNSELDGNAYFYSRSSKSIAITVKLMSRNQIQGVAFGVRLYCDRNQNGVPDYLE